jgi:BRO family, N-terminal domain.
MMEVFENQEVGSIRVLPEAGKTFFCASDVAKTLGYVNPYARMKPIAETPNETEGSSNVIRMECWEQS